MATKSSYDALKRRVSSKRTGKASYEDLVGNAAKKRYSEDVKKVDNTYINSFLKDAGSFMSDSQKKLEGMTWAGAQDSGDREIRYGTMKDLNYRAKLISYYLDNNRDRLDQDTYSKLSSALGEYQSGFTQVDEAFGNASKYFSQWDSEDAYNGWKTREDFISAYLDDPEKATATMDYEKDWVNEAKYRAETKKVQEAKDFQNFSRYASTKTDNWWDTAWSQYSMGYGDLTYEYINNQGDIRDEISKKSSTFRADTKTESSFEKFNYMTKEEVSVYNYYYAKEGKKRAEEYLDFIGSKLEERANQETVQKVSETAREHPFLSSALSVGTSLGSGFEYIGDVIHYGADKLAGKDVQLGTNEAALITNTVRGTVSDMVDWEIGSWDAFDFLYSTAMSGADSLASGFVFGNLGGAVLGLSAAAQGTNDALDRGMSSGQAFWNGLFSGVFEGLFETVSIGNFNKLKEIAPDSVKTIFKNLGKSMLVNASEEALTEIANIGYDTLINGDFANYTWEELKNGAWKDALAQVIEAGASGALMGIGMGGIGNAIGYYKGSQDTKQVYGDGTELVGEALEIDPGNAFAQKMQGKLDRGKSLSGGQINRLVQQNEKTMTAQDMQTIEAAAAQRLRDLGETGSVDTIAAALAKQAAGEKLSRAEKQAISDSKYGSRVANELNTENIRSGDYSSQWAESIDTNKINFQEYSRMLQEAQQAQAGTETAGGTDVAQVQNEARAGQMASAGGNVVVAENATTEESSVAEDGVTRQVSTGKEVTPQKIVSMDGGKVMIQTDSGTIASDDIQFGTKDADLLWRSAANFQGITPAGANGIIHAYRSGDSVTDYIKGAAQEFRNGYYNMESGGEDADKLTSGQREIIYRLGQKAAGENTAKAQAVVSKKEKTTHSQGEVHFDRKGRTFDQKRETALKTMEQLSKVLGIEFHVYESYVNEAGRRVYRDANGNEKHAPNGWYDPSDGSIHIDLNAGAGGKGTMLFTISHELTHFIREWSPAKFKVLANFLVTQYGEKGVSVEELVQRQIAKAEKNGRTIDYDTAFEEVVADSMEAMLTDGNVQQVMADLKQQDKTLWQKICDWFKDLAADLKALVDAYKGVEPDSLEGRMVAQMQDVITILERLYADALVDAGANFQAARAQKNTTPKGDVKMSVRTVDGNEVVWIEDSGFTNAQLRNHTAIAQYIAAHIGEFYRIIESGQKVYIGEDLPGEYTQSGYTSYLKNSKPNRLKAKNKAATALGEMIEIATNRRWEKTKHPNSKDAKYGMYRYDTKFAFPIKDQTGKVTTVKAYDAELLIRNASDGKKYLYDIVGIKEDTTNAINLLNREARSGSYKAASQGDVVKDNVAQDAGNVKEKFSLRDTVEETKDLVAVHNLTEEKLIKSLRLGGLPMPSIAILRAQDGHSEFGDISLVFGRDSIDPQAYRTNKLYSGDAWTPTYPQVEYKVNDKVRKQIREKIESLVSADVLRDLGRVMLDADNMSDTLNRYGGDIVAAFKDNDALKYAYLLDSGADITLPMKEKRISYGSNENGEIIRVAEAISADEIKQAMHGGSEEIRKLEPRVRQAVTEYWQAEYGDDPGALELLVPKEELSFADLDMYLSDAMRYHRNGVERTVDTKKARTAIADQSIQTEYEKWLKQTFSGIVEKEGIRNNADYFTPSGNRRSFEALHYEHNLENVIKAMREKGEKGIATFGGGSIFGASTTEFSSIEEMKQAGERLQKIPEEEYQKMRDAFSNRFLELASSLPNNKNSWVATDDAANMLVEAVTRYSTKSGMANYIRRESQGWATYSDYVVDDLIELVRDIRNMPTGYFEAKPRRAVGFDEVATAIVPDSISQETRSKLEQWDIPFVEYTAGDEEARKTALNSLEGVKFSDRDTDGNQLSQEQQEYFEDSKVRSDQGRLLVMYHGTPNGGFTKFRSGTYFTQNPGYADVYQNPGASSISAKKGAESPMTYKVYLDIKKPFDTRNARERKIFMEEFYRKYGTGTPLAESGLPDWVDGKDVGNKTPTNDPDIRFSERDPELEKVNRVLAKENAELKYDIAYLKELLKLQKQVTGGTKFTKTSVEAAAGQLMKYAGAKGERKELAGLLNGMYEYIAGRETPTWDGIKEAAQPAVDWLQSHVRTEKRIDSYAQDVLREIRGSRVYLDETQKKEVAYQFGSYGDYRKKMMGSVIFTDKASMSLDSQWHEWAGMYPNIFDPEMTATDMPAALMDAIDQLRNMTDMDSYGYDEELFSQDLLRQVYESYWNVSTLYTVTDKAQKEINKLKYEHSRRMAALRKFHNEKTAQLKQEHREDLQRIRQEARERTEKKLQELSDRYQESRKKGVESRRKTEMRRKIRRTVMDLSKLLNRGDKKRNVKEDMQDLVAKALRAADILFTDEYSSEDMVRDGVGTELTEQEAKYMADAQDILAEIDGTGTLQERREAEDRLRGKLEYRLSKLKDVFIREKARLSKTKVSGVLGDLADAYASLENSEYSYVSGAFDENVHQYLTMLKAEVGGTTVKDMSLNQLEDLHRAYTMVLTTVRNANKMFAANLKQTREQLGSQTIGEVKQAGGEHGLWLPGEDKANAFSWNNQKPVYAFERIGSPTLAKLYENTRAGEDSWAKDMTEAREYFLAQKRKYKYDSWDFEKRFQFTSTSGIDFKLDLEQIMSLYAYSKREQAHDHLLKGGFVFDGNTEVQVNKMGIKVTYLNKTAKAHNVSMELLAEITSKLTAEQRGFVDEMQDYLSTTMGAKGNEVSMQMYGVELFKEKHYFPLRSAGQYMARAKEADLKKQQGQISIVNSGFTKATTPKSSNPVVLSGFMDVWAGHVNEMSMYHSFVLPMEDFRRIYNYASPNMETGQSVSVNSVIQDAYGEAATGYIDQLYRDLNGGAVSDPRDTPIKALMGKFKKAAVFASLSVVIQQPSAIGRAFAIIDPKYFIGGKVNGKRHKALWAELKQYAPVATIKEMGYFDTGMGKSAQDFIRAKEYDTIREKAAALFTDESYRDELLSKGPALADELTWCAIWEAVKRETKAKNPGMQVTSEEFLTAAGARFTEVVTRTQVYDSVLARSGNMRSKGLMTMWTAFMAEPTTTINMVEDALRKGKKGDKKQAARVMGAVLSSVILNSMLVSLVRAMRDDDEDETWLEKYMQSFATEILDGINPLTYYPFLKDVWSALQGFDIERSDMSLITSLTEAITKLVQVYSKDTDGMDEEQLAEHSKRLADAWWGVADYVTALVGIPVKNVRRDVNGAVNLYKTVGADLDGRDTSWGSLVDKTWDDVKNAIPVVGWLPDGTAADKLYKATVGGDTAYQKRLESAYSSKTSLDNAIRKGLRNNDPRIWEAAIAWNDNDLESYMGIAKEIIGEGHFSQDNVVLAIQAEAKAMVETQSTEAGSKAKGYFTMEKFAVAVAQGNRSMAATIKADILETAKANGKTAEEAEDSFRSSAKSKLKEVFMDGGVTKAQAERALADYCGVDEEDAQVDVQYWAFQKDYPDYDLSESAVTKYYESIQSTGISVDVYYDYYTQTSKLEGDKDENGNTISGSKKAKILSVIDAMDITNAQKDALYHANGWAESTIYEAPWH